MNLNIRVDGVANLQHQLKETVSEEKIAKVLELGAVIIQAEAKRYCPVRYGMLMKSITHHKVNNLTQEIVAGAPYADYVEYGTFQGSQWTPEAPLIYTSTSGKYPSYRPFLRSAAYDNFDRVIALFDKEMHLD